MLQQPAAAYCRHDLSIAEELGMRPLAAHCHLDLARLNCRLARPRDARNHAQSAPTLYRDMDMRLWLEQAQAEIDVLEA